MKLLVILFLIKLNARKNILNSQYLVLCGKHRKERKIHNDKYCEHIVDNWPFGIGMIFNHIILMELLQSK